MEWDFQEPILSLAILATYAQAGLQCKNGTVTKEVVREADFLFVLDASSSIAITLAGSDKVFIDLQLVSTPPQLAVSDSAWSNLVVNPN